MSGLVGYGELLLGVGLGAALGGILANWRYRGGLGETANRLLRAMIRYGTIQGVIGLAVIVVGAVLG